MVVVKAAPGAAAVQVVPPMSSFELCDLSAHAALVGVYGHATVPFLTVPHSQLLLPSSQQTAPRTCFPLALLEVCGAPAMVAELWWQCSGRAWWQSSGGRAVVAEHGVCCRILPMQSSAGCVSKVRAKMSRVC